MWRSLSRGGERKGKCVEPAESWKEERIKGWKRNKRNCEIKEWFINFEKIVQWNTKRKGFIWKVKIILWKYLL